MKNLFAALFAAAGLTLAGGVAAADAKAGEALMKASGCAACHSIDKKLVGPAYKEVAAKYKNDKGAEARLVNKVKAGGSGVWGPVPMPPHPQLKDDDIKSIVHWILSLR
ncbi:MAG: c-type cytochrome [Burkholderiales bacterium]